MNSVKKDVDQVKYILRSLVTADLIGHESMIVDAIIHLANAVEALSTKTQKIKPYPECSFCHGNGEVFDIVPYGSTTTSIPSFCECVECQTDEDTDEIELDLSE